MFVTTVSVQVSLLVADAEAEELFHVFHVMEQGLIELQVTDVGYVPVPEGFPVMYVTESVKFGVLNATAQENNNHSYLLIYWQLPESSGSCRFT